ncbi:MAG: undecaprenyl-diphosphate phosphatase [Schwartzia sp.]|nr:undecaprenyl-diphosphate phosphatase [Schwartzia sp. (in: firmicutes)]
MDLNFAELIKAIIIGVVEGITEWLPISSTGHMILVDEFIKLDVSKAFMDMFLVVIQLGAILSVVVLNFDRLNPFSSWKTRTEKKETIELWKKVVVACFPAGVIGLAFNKYMEQHFMTALVVASTLIIYGVLFIVVENTNADRTPRIKSLAQMDYKTALIIGCFQVLSLVPGTSRSGSTILGGILFGASRFVATEFTFFLAIPIMFGASLLKLVKFGWHYTGGEILILLVGMATAFIVSIISIKLLLRYIKKNDFKAFGWYRIGLGLLVLAYLFLVGDPVGTE